MNALNMNQDKVGDQREGTQYSAEKTPLSIGSS